VSTSNSRILRRSFTSATRATRSPPAPSSGRLFAVCLCCILLYATRAGAGFDHLFGYDNSGIWKRSNQQAPLSTLIGGEIAGAIWLDGEDRLGKTFWQAIDSSAPGAVSSEAIKHIFTRARSDQTDGPNLPHGFMVGLHRQF
jgi:hypothetical protein